MTEDVTALIGRLSAQTNSGQLNWEAAPESSGFVAEDGQNLFEVRNYLLDYEEDEATEECIALAVYDRNRSLACSFAAPQQQKKDLFGLLNKLITEIKEVNSRNLGRKIASENPASYANELHPVAQTV